MVGVEDLAGPAQVEPVAAGLAPGQDRQPVEIGADDRVFRRAGVHPGEPLELALGLAQHLLRRIGLLDPLPQLGDLGVLAFALAQLVLDRLELLAEEMVALGLGQLAADLLLDLGRKLEDRELTRQVLPQPLQPGPDVDLAQQALLLLDRERQARGQQVRQPARLARVDRRDLQLLGDLLALVDHPLEEPVDVMHQGVELDPSLDDLLVRLDLGRSGTARSAPRSTSRARYCPWQTIRVEPSGNLSILRIRPTQTIGYRSSIPGAVGLGMELADQPDHPLADHAIVDQPDAAGPVDHQRHHGLRKDHVGSQREQGNAARLQRRIVVPLAEHDELSRVSRRPTVDSGVSDCFVARFLLWFPRSASS